MSNAHQVTRDWVLSRLSYEAQTGEFRWLGGKRGITAGKLAGTVDDEGYVEIRCERLRLKAHRLAWLVVYGEFPPGMLDHKDQNKRNNSIGNLRLASHSENKQNESKARSDSVTGLRGVSPVPSGKFCATISIGKRNVHLGVFKTATEAQSAYLAAKRKHHPFAEVA